MTDPQTTLSILPECWSVFRTSDRTDRMEGLVARELDGKSEDIRIYWSSKGDAFEIAARLREMANAIEGRMEKYAP